MLLQLAPGKRPPGGQGGTAGRTHRRRRGSPAPALRAAPSPVAQRATRRARRGPEREQWRQPSPYESPPETSATHEAAMIVLKTTRRGADGAHPTQVLNHAVLEKLDKERKTISGRTFKR
jgi:hypothetical protein